MSKNLDFLLIRKFVPRHTVGSHLFFAGAAANERDGDGDEVGVDGLCVAAVGRDAVLEGEILDSQARLELAGEARRDAAVPALHHRRRRCSQPRANAV